MKNQQNKLVIFQDKKIRRVWHKNEWFFSVVDIVEILSESSNSTDYLKKIRKRDVALKTYIGTNCPQVEVLTKTGKKRKTLVGNTENIFRIIQSIPSSKAEPFKRWLAKVGKERIDEIENPELAQERMKKLYEQKGYPKSWIDKRLRGIAIRQNLTDEWKERGIISQTDYATLTAEISKATFGMTPSEYRKFKNISDKSKSNLRDNMNDFELIFTMLGEKVITEISKKEKPNKILEHSKVANRGGNVAGKARKETEKEIGRSIISSKNNLLKNKSIKRKE
jgi:hypothetical protein